MPDDLLAEARSYRRLSASATSAAQRDTLIRLAEDLEKMAAARAGQAERHEPH